MFERSRSPKILVFGALLCFALASVGTGFFSGSVHSSGGQDYSSTSSESSSQQDAKKNASIVSLKAQNAPPLDRQERENRDLAAQESMSLWAFWLLIVSVVGTVTTVVGTTFLLWQIILTRKAVKDTGDATKAMVRQNELAEAAQRPWIAIDAEFIEFRKLSEHAVSFDFNVNFTNVGKMIAKNFYGRVLMLPMNEPLLVNVRKQFDSFERELDTQQRSSAIIPGQTFPHPSQSNYAIEHLPWCEVEGYRKDCFFMLLAMAQYRIPGEDRWRYSMQSFALGERIDNIDNFKIIYDSVRDLTTEKLSLRPLGGTRVA